MSETQINLSLLELCQMEDLEESIIVEVVEHGIAEPVEGKEARAWVFDSTTVFWMQKAVRLHQDLEMDWIAVAMVIDLLQEKEQLEREIERYQQQLQRFYL